MLGYLFMKLRHQHPAQTLESVPPVPARKVSLGEAGCNNCHQEICIAATDVTVTSTGADTDRDRYCISLRCPHCHNMAHRFADHYTASLVVVAGGIEGDYGVLGNAVDEITRTPYDWAQDGQ
jgi:hypothetical protein